MDRWRVRAVVCLAMVLISVPLGCDDDTAPETGLGTETSGGAATPGDDESPAGSSTSTSTTSHDGAGTTTEAPPQATTDATTSGATTDDPGDGSSGSDGAAAAVSGFVTRSVEPGAGGDATGTLYLSLMQTCETGASAIAGMEIADADLSVSGTNVPFSFEAIAAGTYQLTGFLDDNGNFDGAGPDLGDLVAVEGVGPGCVEISVGDADVQNVALDLNFVMPF